MRLPVSIAAEAPHAGSQNSEGQDGPLRPVAALPERAAQVVVAVRVFEEHASAYCEASVPAEAVPEESAQVAGRAESEAVVWVPAPAAL